MADTESDYKVGPGRPPPHTRFQKGQSGNPGGRRAKSLPALLADALNETVVVAIDGRRRAITKREAIVTQMVDKSASADLRATKMLIAMMKDIEHKAVDAAPPPEPRRLAEADKEVVQHFVRGCAGRSGRRSKKRKCRGPPAQGLSKRRAEKRERIPPFAEAGQLPAIGTGERTSRPLGSAAFTDPLERRLGRRKPGPSASWCRHSDRATLCQSVRPAGDQLGEGHADLNQVALLERREAGTVVGPGNRSLQ